MGNIIDKLYQIQLNSEDFFWGDALKEGSEKEWMLYGFLYERLEGEERKAFLEYIKLKGERQNEEIEASFQRGVQTAIKFFIEGLKE